MKDIGVGIPYASLILDGSALTLQLASAPPLATSLPSTSNLDHCLKMLTKPVILDSRLIRVICPLKQQIRHLATTRSRVSEQQPPWSYPPASVSIDNDQVARLASKPLHSLTLADLVQ